MSDAPHLRQAPASRKPWWRRLGHAGVQAWRSVALLDDTPERIARGAAAGVATAFLPMLGQTFAGMLLARLIGGNVIASLPWTWITNPFTVLPIWYGCYRLGAALVPGHEPVGWDELAAVADRVQQASWGDLAGNLLGLLGGIAAPLLLGTVLVGAACGALSWLGFRAAVRWLQARRDRRRAAWTAHAGLA